MTDAIARYCRECEVNVPSRIVGHAVKCMECGFLIRDPWREPRWATGEEG